MWTRDGDMDVCAIGVNMDEDGFPLFTSAIKGPDETEIEELVRDSPRFVRQPSRRE